MFTTIFLQANGVDLKQLIFPIAIVAIFYIFIILPQRKRVNNEKKFQATVKKGSKVVTTSGIHGKIAEINDNDNTVTIETGAGKIKFERSAISMELSKKYNTDKK
ncbi:MAG: preprotein translocase subunit YajC [Tenacibaculum sp.]